MLNVRGEDPALSGLHGRRIQEAPDWAGRAGDEQPANAVVQVPESPGKLEVQA